MHNSKLTYTRNLSNVTNVRILTQAIIFPWT